MERINHASAVSDKFGAGKDGWTNGDPTDESSGTVPQAEWFDSLQEEVANVIEADGTALNPADLAQLAAAVVRSHYLQDATKDRRLIFQSDHDSDQTRIRLYTTDSGNFEITHNAFWVQGLGWDADALAGVSSVAEFKVRRTLTSQFPELTVYSGGIAGGSFAANRKFAYEPPVSARVQLSAGTKVVTGRGFDAGDITLNATDATIAFTDSFADANYIVNLTGEFDSAHFFYDFDRINASSITLYALNSNFAQQTMSSFVGTFHITVEGELA